MNLQEGFLTIVPQCFSNTGFTLGKKQEEVVTYSKRPIMNAVRMNSEGGKKER